MAIVFPASSIAAGVQTPVKKTGDGGGGGGGDETVAVAVAAAVGMVPR